MLAKFIELSKSINIDALDVFADRVGLTSIFTTVGITVAQDMIVTPWGLTDYALVISCIGGSLFIIEKMILIYIRIREARKITKEEKKNKIP